LKTFVQWRELKHGVNVSVLVKNERKNGQICIDRRVPKHKISVVDGDGDEIEHNGEERLDNRDDETSVEDELGQDSGTTVRKSSVPQNKLL
jgi:hypothetical protein